MYLIFVFALSCRLSRKLEDSQEAQTKLVQVRTSQNKFLMNEMNKLRRYNRKLEVKLREAVARVEAGVHRPKDDNASGYDSSLGADEISAVDEEEKYLDNEKGIKASPTPAGCVSVSKSRADAVPNQGKKSPTTSSTRAQKGFRGGKKRANVGIPTNKLIPLLAKEESSIAGNCRRLEMRKESERASQAEAALDEALTDNKKLASVVHALTGFLKTEGYKIEGLLT